MSNKLTTNDLNLNINWTHKFSSELDIDEMKDMLSESILIKLKPIKHEEFI